MPRRKPYTTTGVKRIPCVRGCGRRGHASWNICADGGVYRAVCKQCDVELNELVMRWAFGDTREDDLRKYREARAA